MQIMNRYWPLLAVFIALALPVSAQEPLTLTSAVQCTLAHHPLRLAAQADVTAAASNLRGARVLRNPEILISPSVLGPAGAEQLLLITQPLEINGAKRARTCIASGKFDAVQAQECITERDLILAVTTAYWSLAQSQDLVNLDAENVHYAETLVQVARAQVDAGNEPEAHLIKAEVELARARQQLTQSQAAVCQAQVELNATMGCPPDSTIILAEKLSYLPVTLNDEDLCGLGLTHRPELQRDQGMVISAAGEADAARAARRPDLFLQFRSVAWNGPGGLAMGLSLPLVDWGSARAEQQRAAAALCAQQDRLAATRLTICKEISSAIITVRSTESQINTLHDQVLAPAEKLTEMTMTGYKEGAMNYLEVLEARRTQRAVQAEYLSALSAYRTALATLEWAVGTTICPTIPD